MLLAALGATLPMACANEGASSGDVPAGGDIPSDQKPGAQSPECQGPLGPPVDPATLPACCPDFGGAHCVEAVPAELTDFVGSCDGGGFCVPDDFISTGGVFTPASCSSINGAGVCMSRCIPQVEQFSGLLKQDICRDTELCVPCVNPLDNTETGACDVAFSCDAEQPGGSSGGDPSSSDDPATCVHEGPPILDPSSLPACDDSCAGAHCVDNSLIPEDQVANFAHCGDGASCVPDELISTGGKLLLETCTSVAGAEGRCLSRCIPQIAAQADQLPQSSCPDTHVCAPCFDPFDGTETGACSQGCDAGPSKPAPEPLPRCCDDIGQCVPASAVPGDQAEKLDEDECPEDEGLLCVPDVFLGGSFTPTPCETSFVSFLYGDEFKPGVCLPGCLPDVDGTFGLFQDDCEDEFKCVPCLKPPDGEPSGACDL